MSHYDIEKLLARVACGTTTERDAIKLRRLLADLGLTSAVACVSPLR